MFRRINVALAAVALGLAGQVAEEVAAPEKAPAQIAAPGPSPVPAARFVVAQRSLVAHELVATALARPLFSLGRRPATPPAAAPAPSPAAVPLPRLAGVSGGAGARAFLARSTGKTVVLAVGEMLDGRVLRAIGADSVVLDGPEGTHRLPLAADETIERTAAAATGLPRPGAPTLDVASPGFSLSNDPPLADAGSEDAFPITLPSDGDGRVRAVLASANAMASAPPPGGCCIPDLGWSRTRQSTLSKPADVR